MYAHLENESSLDRFLEGFEAGTLTKAEWTHAAHVTMAACYSLRYSEAEALKQARDRIRHLNGCLGTQNTADSGYHETLTVFWLRLVRGWLGTHARELPRLEAVRRCVEQFGRSTGIWRDYYTYDVVKCREARREWREPDREVVAVRQLIGSS